MTEDVQEPSLTPAAPTPGTNAIFEVTIQVRQGDPPKDYVTNTFHTNSGSTTLTPANWTAAANAILNAYSANVGTWSYFFGSGITVNAYDMADPKPRPEKAHVVYTPSSWSTTTLAPRQVALRVSYYAFRNLRNQRGGVYLGPWPNSVMGERPTATLMTNAMGLINTIQTTLFGLSPSWSLSVYSKVTGQNNPIDHLWINDVWDTQRRRSPKETTRQHIP